MSEFSAQIDNRGSETLVALKGAINENSELPDIPGNTKLIFDLGEITYINSIGIKSWIEWITPIAASSPIEFVNCPKSMIMQMNMVKNFLPENSKVISFQLPLFCEECDKESNALITVATDIEIDGEDAKVKGDLSQIAGCTQEDCEVEMDVIPKKYFRFLTKA